MRIKKPFRAANKLELEWYTFIFIQLSGADEDKFTAPQQNANCVAVRILLPGGVPNMSFKQALLLFQSLEKKRRRRN